MYFNLLICLRFSIDFLLFSNLFEVNFFVILKRILGFLVMLRINVFVVFDVVLWLVNISFRVMFFVFFIFNFFLFLIFIIRFNVLVDLVLECLFCFCNMIVLIFFNMVFLVFIFCNESMKIFL